MGRTTRGTLTQNFKIRLDITKLREYLEEQIIKAIESEKTKGKQTFTDVEIVDSDYDSDFLDITGSYDTAFENWYCRATLEEPEEDITEYEGIEGWGDGLLCELPDVLKELITVDEIEAGVDDVEYHDYDDTRW